MIIVMITFFIIATIIGISFYFIMLRIKKQTSKQARETEIIGYYLLCVVLVWEFYLKKLFLSEFYNSDMFFLHQRLSIIFDILTKPVDISTSNKLFYLRDGQEYIKKQLILVDIIEITLKVASTYCISIGRLHELVKKK